MKKQLADAIREIADRISPNSPASEKSTPPTVPAQVGSPQTKEDLLDNIFRSVLSLGLKPEHIIDVGANCGDWTRQARRHFPHARFTLIEPNPEMAPHLQDLVKDSDHVALHIAGAAEKSGEMLFTIVDRADSCNFRISQQEAARHGFQQIHTPVYSVDDLLSKHRSAPPQILKIDAEGLDLSVLRGATQTLRSCELVFAEAAVMCKPMGAPFENTVWTLTDYMHQNGFTVFDITDLNRTKVHGNLWLIEMAFVKLGGLLDNGVSRYC